MKPPIQSTSFFLPPAEEKNSVEKKMKSEYSNLKAHEDIKLSRLHADLWVRVYKNQNTRTGHIARIISSRLKSARVQT